MFERFSERGRQVVVLAQDESGTMGHGWIGTEHLLLGVLREGGVAARALELGGLTIECARDAVTSILGSAAEITSGQIPFTPEAKGALEESVRLVVQLRTGVIDPRLVLLGVLASRNGTAGCVIRDCAIDTDAVVAALSLPGPLDPAGFRPDPAAMPERGFAQSLGFFESAPTPRHRRRMTARSARVTHWEYRLETWGGELTERVEALNSLGAEGWQLAATIGGSEGRDAQLIFQRRAQPAARTDLGDGVANEWLTDGR